MQLLVEREGDYCLLKVLIAASLAGVSIPVKKSVSFEELSASHPDAKSLVLETPKGSITQHVAILRYLSELAPAAGLTGKSAFDSSQCDQWLDFSWNQIGMQQHTPHFTNTHMR